MVEKGKQWSAISKVLSLTRTEHMVKNRFKSILLAYSKMLMISKKNLSESSLLQRVYKTMLQELILTDEVGSNS